MFMVNRVRKVNRAAQFTTASDWLLLVLLWITGATGFLIEVALYLPNASAANPLGYWVFLFHVAVAMELMLLLPFTKFAHAMYRPVALFFYALAADKSKQTA
jgi:nitrate reductase gamma subunit